MLDVNDLDDEKETERERELDKEGDTLRVLLSDKLRVADIDTEDDRERDGVTLGETVRVGL